VTRDIAALTDEILQSGWRSNPTNATALGIHDYDERLIDCDPGALQERAREVASQRRDLARVAAAAAGIDPAQAVDLRILAGALEVEERLLDTIRPAFRDPAFYLDEILYGVYYLTERGFAPLGDRLHTAALRLRQVPRLLRQARTNLSDPAAVPREWAEAALAQLHGAAAFLSGQVPALAGEIGKASPEIEGACAGAVRALEEYGEFLRGRILDRARGSFAAGKDLFELMLRAQHGLEPDADGLHGFVRRLMTEAEARLDQAARAAGAGRSWQDLVDAWKSDHPSESDLVEEYRKEVGRAREFVLERGLASLPEGETLRVVETPPFQRSTTPFAAYVAPSPFEDAREGVLWVTPPDAAAPAAERARMLHDHLRPAIQATVAHEAYPGHHLQLSVAARIPSRVRRAIATPVLVEGWAFYCEEMMAEQSYYTDPRSRVLQLKDVLWRAARVVIDVGLHTRGMTTDEAATLLTRTVRIEPPNARVEVLRYTRMPTQPMSYAVGRQALLDLRETVRQRRGAAFDLKRFHDELLSYGSIPVGVIRERMLATSSPAEPPAPHTAGG